MIFMSQELTGKLPFQEIYLHAMIRDAHGRKMSKSLGNVIDPLNVIHGVSLMQLNKMLESGNLDPKIEKAKEGQAHDYPNGIPECGTDALRFALMNYTSQSRDINLDVLRIQGYRDLRCHIKNWNLRVYFQQKCESKEKLNMAANISTWYDKEKLWLLSGSKESSILDRWILSRLSYTVESSNSEMSNYHFSRVTTILYNFWQYDFCDIYIEGCKPMFASDGNSDGAEIARKILFECVETGLRLLSPIMPFITEELWQRLPPRTSKEQPESICVAPYPEAEQYAFRDETLENRVARAMHIVKTVRSLRSDYGLTAKVKTELYIIFESSSEVIEMENLVSLITILTSSSKVSLLTADKIQQMPRNSVQILVSTTCKISLLLEGIVDVRKEITKLTNRQEKLIIQLQKLEETRSNPAYTKVASLLAESEHLNEVILALKNLPA
ncbi:Valine--tRNA ligase [Dirofilaria immitis]|nr:Valine--tRNA ligase [Dirofilaria immitis]